MGAVALMIICPPDTEEPDQLTPGTLQSAELNPKLTGSLNVSSICVGETRRAAKVGGKMSTDGLFVVPSSMMLPTSSRRLPRIDASLPGGTSRTTVISVPRGGVFTWNWVVALVYGTPLWPLRSKKDVTWWVTAVTKPSPGSRPMRQSPLLAEFDPGRLLPATGHTGSVKFISTATRKPGALCLCTFAVKPGGVASDASSVTAGTGRPAAASGLPPDGGEYVTVGVEAVEESSSCVMSSDAYPADAERDGETAAVCPSADAGVAVTATAPVVRSAATDLTSRFGGLSPSSWTVHEAVASVPESAPAKLPRNVTSVVVLDCVLASIGDM